MWQRREFARRRKSARAQKGGENDSVGGAEGMIADNEERAVLRDAFEVFFLDSVSEAQNVHGGGEKVFACLGSTLKEVVASVERRDAEKVFERWGDKFPECAQEGVGDGACEINKGWFGLGEGCRNHGGIKAFRAGRGSFYPGTHSAGSSAKNAARAA